MFKTIATVFFALALCASSLAQSPIEWESNDQLVWSNFKGRPNKMSQYHALTNSGISFETTYENGVMKLLVTCSFNPMQSWVKPDKKSDELLKHEQIHFDITEVHARKLRKALAEHPWKQTTLEKDLNKLFDKYLKMQDEMQHQYDEDTDHSNNADRQVVWNKRIEEELKRLEKWSEPSIELKL